MSNSAKNFAPSTNNNRDFEIPICKTFTPQTPASVTWVNVPGAVINVVPISSDSKFKIDFVLSSFTATSATGTAVQITRNGTPIDVGGAASSRTPATVSYGAQCNNSGTFTTQAFSIVDSPATTSLITYQVQITTSAGSRIVGANGNNTTAASSTIGCITVFSILEV